MTHNIKLTEDDIIVRIFIVWGRIWQILYLFVQRFVMWLSLLCHSLPNLQVKYFITLKASPALHLLAYQQVSMPSKVISFHYYSSLSCFKNNGQRQSRSWVISPSSIFLFSLSFFPWNFRRRIISSDCFPGCPSLSDSSRETNVADVSCVCLISTCTDLPIKLLC